MTVPLSLVLSFLVASLATSVSRKVSTVLKVSIYIPSVISGVIASITFVIIYDYSGGLLNALINIFGALSRDRQSTRLNSSHVARSYAVYCMKKKKPKNQ